MNNINNFLRLIGVLVIGYVIGSVNTCRVKNKQIETLKNIRVDTVETFTNFVEYITLHDTFTQVQTKEVVKIKYKDLIKYRDTGSYKENKITVIDTIYNDKYVEVIKNDSLPISHYKIDTTVNINGTGVKLKSNVTMLGTLIDFSLITDYKKTTSSDITLIPKIGVKQTPIVGLQLIVNKVSLEGIYDLSNNNFGGMVGYKIKLK